MALEYFPCYHSYLKKIEKLSDQEVGRLFRSLLKYSMDGETEELTGRESIAFDFIVADIDRAKNEYDRKCEKNRANAYERYRTHTNDSETCQSKSKSKSKNKSEDVPPYNPPKGKVDVFADFCGDDVSILEALRSFDEMRKKIRKPMTDNARQLLLKKLQKQPYADWLEILEQSTLNGWQDIYPLKGGGKNDSRPAHEHSKESTAGKFDFLVSD